MRVGQARKRDSNEGDIKKAFEQLGWIVRKISAPGLPDLLLYRRGGWRVVEVKAKGGSLTPAQVELQHIAPFDVVESVEQVLRLEWAR